MPCGRCLWFFVVPRFCDWPSQRVSMFPEAYEPIDLIYDGNLTKMLHLFNAKRPVILREHALARCFERRELPFAASGTAVD